MGERGKGKMYVKQRTHVAQIREDEFESDTTTDAVAPTIEK